MGSLLKSLSRLVEQIHYWVSGLEPARIEAGVRQIPHRFLKLPNHFEKRDKQKVEYGKSCSLITPPFTDIPQFVRGMEQRSDLHKDDLEGLPLSQSLSQSLDKFALIEA
jgi:hypothetical protein